MFSASWNGRLVYATGTTGGNSQIVWTDRSGQELGAVGEYSNQFSLMLSPDDKTLAVTSTEALGSNLDIWLYELDRGTLRRLTQRGGNEFRSVWDPSGEKIAFSSDLDGSIRIIVKDADGNDPGRPLWPSDASQGSRPTKTGARNLSSRAWPW